jgi:uncharacterized membrane protein YeaQ/YmgE (transglycosylase-associated protein family)
MLSEIIMGLIVGLIAYLIIEGFKKVKKSFSK